MLIIVYGFIFDKWNIDEETKPKEEVKKKTEKTKDKVLNKVR